MKRNLKLLVGIAIFVFAQICVRTADIPAGYSVAQGSQFHLDALEDVGLQSFSAKPKVYATIAETKTVRGIEVKKIKKIYISVLTKDYPANKILCEWIAKAEPGTYELYVLPKGKEKKTPILVSDNFQVMPPSISEMSPDHGVRGQEIFVYGDYFGKKKPKTWFELELAGRKKRSACKVIENVMDENGISELNFLVPKLIPGASYDFHLKNSIGEAVAQFIASNSAPIASDDSFSTLKNTPITIPVLANDFDPEGDSLSLLSVDPPSHGSASIAGDSILYTPETDYLGQDSFKYKIADSAGLSSEAAVVIAVVEETPDNPPVAVADSAETKTGIEVEIPVLLNDSDPDSDPMAVVSVSTPSNGQARISSGAGKITYAPHYEFTGADSFSYTISDGRGGSDSADVAVIVKPANTAPTPQPDSAETQKNTATEIDVLDNDSDPDGDELEISAVSDPAHGKAEIGPSGTVIYTPTKGYLGTDSFEYTVSDEKGLEASADVSVKVSGSSANSPPIAFNDSVSTAINQAVEIDVLANDSDEDGDSLSVSSVSSPSHGSVEILSGSKLLRYTPQNGYTGTDSFEYTVSDGKGGTDTGKVSVVVLGVSSGKCVILDLSPGPGAASYSYEYSDSFPSDLLDNEEYKTVKLVLARISAGTFSMGSPEDEIGRFSNETAHSVTLSKDFYVGVFEITQVQYENVMGENPSRYEGDSRPVETVSWNKVRGGTWPSGSPSASSFAGLLSEKCGLTFDLPTEAQWEYACRAGTETALNSGLNLTTPAYCPNLDLLGWYTYNSFEEKHREVGEKTPNTWGLYDMHGNVWEWCLDYYADYTDQAQNDPVGASEGEARLIRGGSWSYYAMNCRSASRNYIGSAGGFDNLGFRILLSE